MLWGAYHALLFLPLILTGKNRKYMDAPTWRDLPKILLTFALVVFGWIIFRATGMKTLMAWVTGIFSPSLFTIPWLMNRWYYIPLAISIGCMLIVEWINRREEHGLQWQSERLLGMKIVAEVLICLWIYVFAPKALGEFIYFQF